MCRCGRLELRHQLRRRVGDRQPGAHQHHSVVGDLDLRRGVSHITPTVSGLQNGENVAVLGGGLICTTGATSASSVGTYRSSCSGAVDANYTISYIAGSVIVTRPRRRSPRPRTR